MTWFEAWFCALSGAAAKVRVVNNRIVKWRFMGRSPAFMERWNWKPALAFSAFKFELRVVLHYKGATRGPKNIGCRKNIFCGQHQDGKTLGWKDFADQHKRRPEIRMGEVFPKALHCRA